jgi:hypothetical protein
MLANLEEVGAKLPSPIMKLLRRFNGKPVLTRPEHTFYRGKGNAYLEISMDGHRYSYATRAAVRASPCSLPAQASMAPRTGGGASSHASHNHHLLPFPPLHTSKH